MNQTKLPVIVIKDNNKMVIEVPSHTEIGTSYFLTVQKNPPRTYCECTGCKVHGYCQHIKDNKGAIEEYLRKPDVDGVPSAHKKGKMFHPNFDGTRWICDCEHYTIYKTDCRHILIKQLEQLQPPGEGVRDTSIEAYIELMNDPYSLNDRYRDILQVLQKMGKPATDREIAQFMLKNDPNYVRPRRNELADPKHFYHPLVREVGKRICTVSGKNAYIWDVTEYGRLFLEDE